MSAFKVLSLVTLVLCQFNLFAQTERQKELVNITFSVVKNIEWPEKSTPFKIHVITTDEQLKNLFREVSPLHQVAGRKVEISFTGYVIVPQDADVLFVTNRYNATIPTLLDRLGNTGTLLITDRYKQQRDIMINFLGDQAANLTFEINRANITNQGLKIKSGMRELGGREVDLAKIFKQVRDSVRALELGAEALKTEFDSMNMKIAVATKLLQGQDRLIAERDREILLKQQEIDKQTRALDSLKREFAESEQKLAELQAELLSRETELSVLSEEIALQKDRVEEGNRTLEEQQTRIAAQNEEIARREERLDEMSTVVDYQKSALVFLILFLVVLVGFSFLIFTAYRARKRAAAKLAEQKEDLARLLQELQETQSQLVQSEKMASLGVLTAGIAHEINNAINFVYQGIHVLGDKFEEIRPAISQAAQGEETNPQHDTSHLTAAQSVIDQMIKSIKVGAERTTEIVKGLRIFSRAESEKMTKIDINEDIDVALLLLKSKHKDLVQIEKNLSDALPQVDGYKGQLSQAFLNIISNAIDAVAENGKEGLVYISSAINEDHIEIRIKDNGTGISEEALKKIFDPFFTTKKVGAGTGLGLAITYGIIERHGGTISVNSKVNEGTEFVIKLPIQSRRDE